MSPRPSCACDGRALNGFLDDRAEGRVGGTTAVFDACQHTLCFSKEVIPFTPLRYADTEPTPVFHHVGVYAYRHEALRAYTDWPTGPLKRFAKNLNHRFSRNAVLHPIVSRVPPFADVSG